jgi:hypothetical protein
MIHVDYPAVWKAIPAGAVEAAAQQIAAQVDVGSTGAEVGVEIVGTSRYGAPVALVTVMHPAGKALQAKYGSLTRAAAACGHEVTSK